MAQRVPLPKYSQLPPELVFFHRRHPADPQVILQIPNEDRTATLETHLIYMDKPADSGWVEHLPNGKALVEKLKMERHVAYCYRSGHLQAIPDVDDPTPIQVAVATARFAAGEGRGRFDRQDAALRRARFNGPAVSALRRYLGSKLR